jgi:hypothetical protein
MDEIENDAFINSSITTSVFIAAVTFMSTRFLALLGITHTYLLTYGAGPYLRSC